MKYLCLILLSFPAYGALSPMVVKESALKFHPTVQAAIESMRASEAAVKGARGAFDARIVSDYRRQTKHSFATGKTDYQTTQSRTQLEKGLRVANSKIYVGAEQISNPTGILSPAYNTGNPATTGLYGNYTILGAKFSLWKNLTLDPDRARLKNSKYDATIAKGEKSLTELNIGRLGQLTYWEWVTALKVKSVYEVLLKNGETRNEYLEARSKKGDIGRILVTENEQYIASRKGSLQAVTERLIRAEYALSLFYRNENGDPVVPTPEETYEDYPENLSALLDDPKLRMNVDELIAKRPDLKNLALTVERSEVDLELAKQDLRPQLDITTEYFKRTVDHRPEMPLDHMMVLGQITVPIERNLGNGNIAAARARKMVAERRKTIGQQSYEAEVMSIRRALPLRLEQVNQAEIEFKKAKELVAAEHMRFKTGGGNLFLVNLREEAQARAEAAFHESRLAFMDSYLTYQALVSTGE